MLAEQRSLKRRSAAITAELASAKGDRAERQGAASSRRNRAMHHVLASMATAAAVAVDFRPDALPARLRKNLAPLVLMVFVLAGWSAHVAAAFALGVGRPRYRASLHLRTDASYRENLEAGIEWLCILAPDGQVCNLFDTPDYYGTWKRVRWAAMYVVEYRLFWWVVQQNCEMANAPGATLLFQKAIEFIPSATPIHVYNRMAVRFASGDNVARSWLSRWRQRWGARVGEIPPAPDNLTTQELLFKAPWLHAVLVLYCFVGPGAHSNMTVRNL